MLQPERHRRIVEELEARGNVTVKELRSLLGVSLDTVRRDLEQLEQQDRLRRVHGGAVSKLEPVTNQSYTRREVAFLERKQELAGLAAGFVKEQQAVALNAGTTNIEVARQLAARFERLTVITNSLKVAEVFAAKSGFTVIVPGGVLNHQEFSLYGRSMVAEIAQFNIDAAFISINAISLEKGLTDFRQGEAEVINAMLRSSRQRLVAADSSKFETVSYLNICGLDQIDAIITDSYLDGQLKKKYLSYPVAVVNEREESISSGDGSISR